MKMQDNINNDVEAYGKYRRFFTLSNKLVVAGKNAEQNEKVIAQADKDEYVLHTKEAGSPFCNIKANKSETNKEDLREAAIFCAKHSQAWKKSKKKTDIEVHVFLGKDIFKTKDMKLGTFGVRKFTNILVKKEEID